MRPPRVTVLMSVHNGGRWLRAAIDGVLAQTWRDFEFLIIDDASTDDGVTQIEAIDDSRIRLIRRSENIGLTRCLNLGLREARGELIARHDVDDLSAPERLAKQVEFMDAHPAVQVVGTQVRLIDAQGRSRGVRDVPLDPASIRWLSLLDNPIIHTAAMFRAAVVRDEFGGYDETFGCCQDYDLWARLMLKHPAANLRERLVAGREHAGSISATRQHEAQQMVRRVVRRLADAWLPELALNDHAIATLCAFRRHLAPEEVAPFHALLARVEAELARRFPESRANRDLARTRAGVFARIGYNLIERDRALAAAELWKAVCASPGIAGRLPWLRMLGLFTLGGNARRWFEALTRRD